MNLKDFSDYINSMIEQCGDDYEVLLNGDVIEDFNDFIDVDDVRGTVNIINL